jgi:phenylacetate-coenzyme A ligase PaaK-like adenylate-forming protein
MMDKQKRALIWNEEFEAMPRPGLEKLQLKRLKDIVAYVAEKVPFYRNL